MPKYRKKPVTVSAWRYDGGHRRLCYWLRQTKADPSSIFLRDGEVYIHTREGDMHLEVGDYLIKGVRGELYPCKPDIFAETYEEVKAGASRGRRADDVADEAGGVAEAAA